jgi:hypothetical protein
MPSIIVRIPKRSQKNAVTNVNEAICATVQKWFIILADINQTLQIQGKYLDSAIIHDLEAQRDAIITDLEL